MRGYAILHLFNNLPTHEILIRIKGKEVPGRHGPAIVKSLLKEPDVYLQ